MTQLSSRTTDKNSVNGSYEQGGRRPRSWQENPSRQLTWACGPSQVLERPQTFLHGTALGPLHEGDNFMAWSFMGTLVVEPEPVADAWVGSSETITYERMSCLALMHGKVSWSNLNLICPCFEILKRDRTLSEWRWRMMRQDWIRREVGRSKWEE